jgi:transcriptional regulator with XRE-family HTH domain
VTESNRQKSLGAFLRAHRERLPVPTTASRRRRTPGLRREELADLCGVSLTWITWLEQGRAVSASAKALGRLADGLRLTRAERTYLFELAGKRDPSAATAEENDLPDAMRDLPQRMTIPAYLLDRTWTARAWNAAAAALFVGWLDGEHDRNLLRFLFFSPAARSLVEDWEERARRIVAEFRADFSRHLRDPGMQALVDELSIGSAEFLGHWREQGVLSREGGERGFNGPRRRYHQSTLIFSSHPDIKLVGLTPVNG